MKVPALFALSLALVTGCAGSAASEAQGSSNAAETKASSSKLDDATLCKIRDTFLSADPVTYTYYAAVYMPAVLAPYKNAAHEFDAATEMDSPLGGGTAASIYLVEQTHPDIGATYAFADGAHGLFLEGLSDGTVITFKAFDGGPTASRILSCPSGPANGPGPDLANAKTDHYVSDPNDPLSSLDHQN